MAATVSPVSMIPRAVSPRVMMSKRGTTLMMKSEETKRTTTTSTPMTRRGR
jgi:hypothetical protein